jgi:serine protease
LTAAQIRNVLLTTAANGNGLPNSGKLVDALAAVQSAQGGGAALPLLVATPAAIDFGASTTTGTITLENRGNGSLVFQGFTFSTSAPWFTGLLSDATPANGIDLDSLAITIDRTGLANGVYSTRVTLQYLNSATLVEVDVEVRMQVGASTTSTDTIYVLLVNPDTLESLFETSTAAGSSFAFAFGGITAGDYLLVAGTDRDNDGIIGDDGELFGAWPSLDAPQAITVTAGVNSTGLEFGMEDFVGVTAVGGGSRPTFRRKP